MTMKNVILSARGLSRISAYLGITRSEVEMLAKKGDEARVAEWGEVKEVAPGLSTTQIRKSYQAMRKQALSESLDMNVLVKEMENSPFIDAIRNFMVAPLQSIDGQRELLSEKVSLRSFVEACLTNDNIPINYPSCDDTFLRWSFAQIRAELDLKSPLDHFPYFEDHPLGQIKRRYGMDPFFLEFPYHTVSDQVISQLPHLQPTFDDLVPSPAELRRRAYEDLVPSSAGAFDDATVAKYLVKHSSFFEKNDFTNVTVLLAGKLPLPNFERVAHLSPETLFPLLERARNMIRVYALVCALPVHKATPSDIVTKATLEIDRRKRGLNREDMASIYVKSNKGTWSRRYHRDLDDDDDDDEDLDGFLEEHLPPKPSYVLEEDGRWTRIHSSIKAYYDDIYDDPVLWALSTELTDRQNDALVPVVLHLAEKIPVASSASTLK